MNIRNSILPILLAASLVFGLAGCSDDDDNGTHRPPTPGKAMLRVVHASVDAHAVDLYVNDGTAPLLENLVYGATSAYLEVPAGDYTVQLRAHGADPASDPAFEVDVTLPADATITAVAAGLLASDAEADRFRVLPLVEGFEAPGAGNAAVRIIHAAPDAPTVALDIGNDVDPEVTNFARWADTGAAGVPLPAGTALRVGVWAGVPMARVSVFTTPALPAGANLFLIATGLVDGEPAGDGFSLLAVGPNGSIGFIRQDERAMVYALHASPDAPAVDIDADGSRVITNLSFGELSGAMPVWPGSYELDFSASGSPAVAASAQTPYLEPGVTYLAIATGFLGGGTPAFQLLPLADGFAGAATDALVRVVHASPDAPAVDVGLVIGGSVAPVADFTNMSFGDSSPAAGTVLMVNALTIGVAATGTTAPVASFAVTTAEGLRAFAVACGSLGGTGASFRLVLVVADPAGWSAVEVMPNE